MDNYTRIKAIIDSWHLALCLCEDYRKIIFSKIMNDWNIRSSDFYNEVKDCMDCLWYRIHSIESINNFELTKIEPLYQKPKMLKVWDMVEIGEIAKECWDYKYWIKDKKDMIWKWPLEIKEVCDDSAGVYYQIFNENKTDFYTFPSRCVCLYTWNTETETIEIWWVKYSKEEVENALKNLKPITK